MKHVPLILSGSCLRLIAAFIGLVVACAVAYRIRWVSGGSVIQHFRARLGWGKDVAELARRLRVTGEELRAVRPAYGHVAIPKRSGGVRKLLVPDEATKKMQRRILRLLLAKLRVHPAVHGFERGKSIVTNARPHVGREIVVKIDVSNFFTATTAVRVDRYFRRIGWNREAAELLTRLCTYDEGLPQGAPTSPRLSNLVNYGLDASLAKLAERKRCAYTRYADDMTFSMTFTRSKHRARRVRGLVQTVRQKLKGYGYEVHGKKLRILRRHQQQRVTGLVVNDKVQLPRRLRRKLRAVRHHLETGREATLTEQQLAGWEGLEEMVRRQAAGREGQPGETK